MARAFTPAIDPRSSAILWKVTTNNTLLRAKKLIPGRCARILDGTSISTRRRNHLLPRRPLTAAAATRIEHDSDAYAKNEHLGNQKTSENRWRDLVHSTGTNLLGY